MNGVGEARESTVGEPLEARIEEARKAVSEDSRDPEALLRAAHLTREAGLTHEAFGFYERLLSVDPSCFRYILADFRGSATTPEQRQTVDEWCRKPATFMRSLAGIWSYPLRGSGWALLGLAAIFLFVARAIARYNILPFAGLLPLALFLGYLAAFYIEVFGEGASGGTSLPHWPDFSQGIFADGFRLFMPYVASFLPAIALLIMMVLGWVHGFLQNDPPFPPPTHTRQSHPVDPRSRPAGDLEEKTPENRQAPIPAIPAPSPSGEGSSWHLVFPIAFGLSVLFGFLYLPMALTVNLGLGNPWACFHPVFVLRAIWATRGDYLLCLLVLVAFGAAISCLELALSVGALLAFTVGPGLAFLAVYGWVLKMRALGLFFRYNQARLMKSA